MGEENKNDTVDRKEVERFTEIVKEWWDTKGPTKLLHDMNALRIPFTDESIAKDGHFKEEDAAGRSKVHILDVGCGGGIMTEGLAKMGYKVTGLDPCDEMVDVAKEHASKSEGLELLDYKKGTIEEVSAETPEKYDAVVVSEVAEHVTNPKLLMHACAKALKPGGTLIVTTINRTILAWLVVILLFEYILRLIRVGTHHYSKLVMPEEIEASLKEANCSVESVKGLVYVPFKGNWCWIPTVKMNYCLHAVKNK